MVVTHHGLSNLQKTAMEIKKLLNYLQSFAFWSHPPLISLILAFISPSLSATVASTEAPRPSTWNISPSHLSTYHYSLIASSYHLIAIMGRIGIRTFNWGWPLIMLVIYLLFPFLKSTFPNIIMLIV